MSHYLQWFIVVKRLYFHTCEMRCDRIASVVLFVPSAREHHFSFFVIFFLLLRARRSSRARPMVRADGFAFSLYFRFISVFFTMTSSLLHVLNSRSRL